MKGPKRNYAIKKSMYICLCFPRSFKKVKITIEYNSMAKVEEAKIKCSAANYESELTSRAAILTRIRTSDVAIYC